MPKDTYQAHQLVVVLPFYHLFNSLSSSLLPGGLVSVVLSSDPALRNLSRSSLTSVAESYLCVLSLESNLNATASSSFETAALSVLTAAGVRSMCCVLIIRLLVFSSGSSLLNGTVPVSNSYRIIPKE